MMRIFIIQVHDPVIHLEVDDVVVVVSHIQADSYGNEKLIRKWIRSGFCFCFFRSYGNENGPDSYSQIRLSVS